MNILRGLLSKMLLLVLVVAVMALLASYTFVSIQQQQTLDENIQSIKQSHLRASRLLFANAMQQQILSAEEIVLLSALAQMPDEDINTFFDDVWPRIQLNFSLSSLSFAGQNQTFTFGTFPRQHMSQIQQTVSTHLRPKTGILCHQVCELLASVPVKYQGETWSLSLLSDLAPSVMLLNSIVGSNVGILSPFKQHAHDNRTLSRYTTELMTGMEATSELFAYELTEAQFKELETQGLLITLPSTDYFVWFENIPSVSEDITIMFVHDVSSTLMQQREQKQQVIIIFVSLAFGILLFLMLFSIIPIAKINRLKRAIKLIGAKEYNIARYRLGKSRKLLMADELDDLEDEFRHAIDVLETYEQELTNSQKRLIRQATIDSITGLFTRNVLIEDLANMNREEHIANVAIFFLDLDGFKPVNDNLGHEAGDIMLKKIGYRLKGVVNKFIRVYRIGGDEFVICYSNYASQDTLKTMAESVVELFSAPFHIYDTSISISASIGIAFQEAHAIEPDRLLRYADIAMYQAKKDGKNCFTFFNEEMRHNTQRRFTIKNDFISSLASGQLYMVFQPIVSARTRQVTKLEALCRWEHPELGHIPPLVFIDVLEESENMNTLFEWIVGDVLDEIAYLDSVGLENIVVSINLSPSQLVNDAALTLLTAMCKERAVASARIELEITETSLITNFEQAKGWVEEATELGFKIAIDDFGAGYSSLSYLTAFPYDTVKLDRSLLNNIDIDKRQQRIVGSLTQMLHGLSVPIVAEGAETEAHFEQLKLLGCDYIQGYLISRPVAHSDLAAFLEKQQTADSAMRVAK